MKKTQSHQPSADEIIEPLAQKMVPFARVVERY